MATRNEFRDYLKQSQGTSEITDTSLSTEIPVITKRSSHNQKQCVNQNDELVKYMSKLPGYLQRIERREESVQSNVLNVGVLDWGRLEKWKHSRAKDGGERTERKVSASSTSSVPNDSQRCKIDDDNGANLGKGKASRDPKHSVQRGVRCALEPELASRDSLNKQEIATCSYKSSAKDDERVKNPVKSRRSLSYQESGSGFLSEMGNSAGKGNLVARDKEIQKKPREIHGQEARERAKDSDKEEKIIGDSEKQENHHQYVNIVLPRSRNQSRTTLSGEPFDDDNTRVAREANRSIDFTNGLRSQIPRSCPLSFDQEDESRRDPSPSKRFSFSFGRLSRSFSQPDDSRISPLRRFLLKPKVVLPSSKPTRRRRRALFQLTIRNGIPLFQFLVNDDMSVLGATTMKDDDSDSVRYCTFYSVNEVKKKKKSWLIHGEKKQQCRFVYNVIGQMRLSLTENIRESVLFDELQKDVAAVVIKEAETETSVIIPGGVHSLPEKGAPSSLISRWRSGGLCDCGGWDVECKLQVFSNKTSSSLSFLHEFDQSFKLFDQEGSEEESGPVMVMTEMKTGIYTVEFSSLLSPLQAFFVCVTVITCGSEAEEEDTVVKTTGKSSSPFAPPLSPVGRV